MPLRVVAHHHHLHRTLGHHLGGDAGHRHLALGVLAAGHGHGGIDQDFVGDARLGRDRGTDRQRAGMGIGAIAHIGEDVPGFGEMLLADPGRALATHMGEEVAAAIHVLGQIMAANAGQAMAALGHPGGGVVRAARAEMRRAQMHRRLGGLRQRVQFGDARQHARGAQRFGQAGMQRAQNLPGIQLGQFAEQGGAIRVALAGDMRPVGHLIQRIAQQRLDMGAAVLNDQHLGQPLGEIAGGGDVEGPRHAELPDSHPLLAQHVIGNASIGQSLPHGVIGLAAHGDAKARARRVGHNPVDAIGPGEGQGGGEFAAPQPRLDGQGEILQPDMQPIGGDDGRIHRGIARRVHHERHGGIHRLGHAFHRHPQAGIAG